MYEEEYILDVLVYGINGWLSFRYAEFFLSPQYANRAGAGLLWVTVYALGKMLYANFAANSTPYDGFYNVSAHFILLVVLQTIFFARHTYRQAFVVASFIAGWEILRFAASPLAHILLGVWGAIWEWLINTIMGQGIMSAEQLTEFMSATNRTALFAVLALCRALQLMIFYLYLRHICRNFVGREYEPNAAETWFLLLPCLAVLCLDLTLRLMAYSVDNSALMLIYDRVPETLVLLPVASLLLLGFVVSSVVLFRGLADGKEEEKKRLLLENRVAEIHTQIGELDGIYRDMRGLKHDLRAHIAGIAAYVRNRLGEDAEGIASYLYGMEKTVARLDFADHTGNPLTDVILHQFRQQAKRKNIALSCAFHYPPRAALDVYDVSVILNNALQNAMEACEKTDGATHIDLRSYEKGNLFFIEVENDFDGAIRWNNKTELPATTKPDRELHGIGLDNIRRTAAKYRGAMEIDVIDRPPRQVFHLTVMLYKRNADD